MSDNNKTEFFSKLYRLSKIIVPVVAIGVLAFTITFALNLSNKEKKLEQLGIESRASEESQEIEEISQPETETVPEDVPMSENTDERIERLVNDFFAARASGDEELLLSYCDEIDEINLYRYGELGKYIDYCKVNAIYTQPGLLEDTYLAYVDFVIKFIGHEEEVPGYQTFYVCTRDDGSVYFKRGNITDEESEYIYRVMAQDDVVEFNNRVYAEYNSLLMEKPEILTYMDELTQQVNITVGVRLGQENMADNSGEGNINDNTEAPGGEDEPVGAEEPSEENGSEQEEPEPEPEPETIKQYVVATTTVNVRSSDSEKAQKLGKASQGLEMELIDAQVNGWSKVIFEGNTGFIKSEYLQLVETAASYEVIGKVTPTTTVNVRRNADQNSTRIGVLAQGDTVDLLGGEEGWSKINYNGQIGYVKSEYVKKE